MTDDRSRPDPVDDGPVPELAVRLAGWFAREVDRAARDLRARPALPVLGRRHPRGAVGPRAVLVGSAVAAVADVAALLGGSVLSGAWNVASPSLVTPQASQPVSSTPQATLATPTPSV
jgi:hypothetical protein